MPCIETERLRLTPFSSADFDLFVEEMLTDLRVVEFYYSYRDLEDPDEIRNKATTDFWNHFEESRESHNLQVWAAYHRRAECTMVGWCGLLHDELSEKYGEPELQYMIAGESHGMGFATEFASAVLQHASDEKIAKSAIATVDIPNIGSIRVLEKLGFLLVKQIHAYGSDDMYLYRRDLVQC
jgi:ribosomal-protein-alanine N-acetyltransferase